ncbi:MULTISPECIES: ABC transporter substrate-binding protein [Haematobacter]|uniref:ABC transporter permease n=1 Tax=Haematobacter genomosp. 1 TaxID=366618 RepID=A0A212AFY8_9RHOB|nr:MULTISPECIES: ABC transporter substrate-binding protein [Haematobacter]OWJ80333.1 ABC transporter permease [Haematobacter genomosp. 1]
MKIHGYAASVAVAALLAAGPLAAQGISDGKVKIGIMNDQSGVYADAGGRTGVEAARQAAEDFGGTVLGAPIEIVAADHQNKTDIGSNIARQWYDTEQVDTIMDLPTSSVALAVQALSLERGKVTISVGGGSALITGAQCTPLAFQWAYDTEMLSRVVGGALVEQGGDSWYFLTADYVFGHSLEQATTKVVEGKGGKVLGAVRHPLATTDYSSFLLQAQSSGAKVIGLASAGLDTANAIKQGQEFGITAGGQKFAALLFTLADVRGLGAEAAQGLVMTENYYWDRNDESRRLGEKIKKRVGVYPNMLQAGVYSAVMQYLKAIEAAGTDDGKAVAAKLHEMPVNDDYVQGGKVLPNGRMVSDVFLLEVKKPSEMSGTEDFFNILATVPGEQANVSAKDSGCPLTQ